MKYLYLIILLAIGFSSCTSRKHLVYLRDVEKQNEVYRHSISEAQYRLKKGDIVYIKILSTNQEMNNLFNPRDFTQSSNGQNINQAMAYLNGFSINEDGAVKLPVMDTIYLAGLTVLQAQSVVQRKVDNYLKNTTVIVKLISFTINILGEVHSPGSKDIFQQDLNIFEALARAGDIKETGDKENVMIIRMENGQAVTYKIDLTNRSLFESTNFKIQPNDIIIVQPLKLMSFRMNTPAYSLILTALSALLLAANIFML